jgi:hypothetical protein
MIKQFTIEEQRSLHHRYKQSDLYRQWLPILAMLQRDYGEMDGITLWYLAERQIVRLRLEKSFREQEISPIYNELLDDCKVFSIKGKANVERSDNQARRSATTIMCIVLTMLMNAVEKGHEEEPFDNEPMCMAIMDVLSKDQYFQRLMALFFERKTGYDGQKVVIAPKDPMSDDSSLDDMDETAQAEMKAMVATIMKRTQGLQPLFKEHWGKWTAIWNDICLDTELMGMLKEINPRGNEWEMNMKMVLNVIGLFKSVTKVDVAAKSINDLLSKKNLRTYIAQHADFVGTNSAFTREQHARVKTIIEKYISNNDR